MYSGLLTSEAKHILKLNGYNEIPVKHTTIAQKIIKNLLSPISLMLILASGFSFILSKAFDGYFILILLFINIFITLWQENKADNAIKKLNEHLEQKIKVLRDKKWVYIESRFLVQGDIIQLASGEVIPIDGRIVESNHATVNESVLTGEPFPKDKNTNDIVYSGSFIAGGIAIIEVTATGLKTSFGKTIFSVERIKKRSLLEKDIISISKFLTVLSIFSVVILTIVFLLEKASFLELLILDLSLIIAGIPVSLPTVMTLIIEFGVLNLAKKNVIIRRLSALEDLANVNFLLTDKTGTLTKNRIVIQDVYSYNGFTHNDVVSYASIISSSETDNPIEIAILDKFKELQLPLLEFKKTDFIPADSERKRSTIFVEKDKMDMVISIGAPQIIADLCLLDKATKEKFKREINILANNCYRTIAVAMSVSNKEKEMKLVGLLALSDTLRPDAKQVIEFLKDNGIDVAMVTGDNKAIASKIADELSLNGGKVITKDELNKMNLNLVDANFYKSIGAFAEILPEDKLHLVQKAKQFFIVASNGDGINDFPALKAANVGIAVKNAVTVLKSTADIVLLSEGISVIRDAIIESRKIFERLYIYSLYRISESLRLIVTIVILGIIYKVYPMTALQIIIIALLNDIPIISLAFDKVKIANNPAKIDAKKRFTLSSLYGLVGVVNSLLLFFLIRNVWGFNWEIVQTMYFLKLTVSGHMLIYVAHTKERWWKFFPSKEVVLSTTVTQLIATILAFTGFLMPAHISFGLILFVWIWSFFWMQVGEMMKIIKLNLNKL